jgi:hypothetical protein
MCSD